MKHQAPLSLDDDLVKVGLVDSADLLEVIVAVESDLPVEFNPEGLDLEHGLTLRELVCAFQTNHPLSADADGKVKMDGATPLKLRDAGSRQP